MDKKKEDRVWVFEKRRMIKDLVFSEVFLLNFISFDLLLGSWNSIREEKLPQITKLKFLKN